MLDLQGFGPLLLSGVVVTIQVAAGALVIGLVLGMTGALAKLSKFAVLRWLAALYTTIFRGLPELLVVLVTYFGAIAVLSAVTGSYVDVHPVVAGIFALSLTFGAYATEIFRGAIIAIPPGQIEAGKAIGMEPGMIFRRVVLPQVWRLALPGLGNLFLVLLKDTALVSVIGVSDVMRNADIARNATKDSFSVYLAAALLYLALTAVTTFVLNRLEARANRGFHRAAS